MAHRIELMKDRSCVRLALAGELTRTDHETARAEAAVELKKNGWNKLLIDAAIAEPKMSVDDDFEFTDDHHSHLPKNLCTAIVHRPSETEKFRFIENVAMNRGMNMKLFTDEKKALDWLFSL